MQQSEFEKDIREVRDGLLSDFRHIADLYQPLQAGYPDQYRNKVTSEMRRYADELKAQPAYHRFCERFHLNHDEFIREVLQQAIILL